MPLVKFQSNRVSLNFTFNPGLFGNILYGLLMIGPEYWLLALTGLFKSKPLKQSVLSISAAIAVTLVLVLEIFLQILSMVVVCLAPSLLLLLTWLVWSQLS